MDKKRARQIAADFMQHIMYDNGCVNALESEQYHLDNHREITIAVENFFSIHPTMDRPKLIENIAIGDHDATDRMFGNLKGFKELDKALENYFDVL